MNPDPLSNRALAHKAAAHRAAMRGLSGQDLHRYVQDVLDGSDVVFGVFPSSDSPDGIGMGFIKGRSKVEAIAGSSNVFGAFRVDALPFAVPEEVAAAEKVFGDGRGESWSASR